MRKSYLIGIACFMASLIGFGLAAQSFTDVNSSTYWGKTGIPALTTALDANFAQVGTTTSPIFAGLTISGASVSVGSLPTATTGLASGRVWLNSNVLTVIP